MAWLLAMLGANGIYCLLAFLYPSVLPEWFPRTSPELLPAYSYFTLAQTILLLFMIGMQKWAFYGFLLLSLYAGYFNAEHLHIIMPMALAAHCISPGLLFLVLFLGGSWAEMK